MKPDVLTWLEDIERSIDEIFEFLPDKSNYLTFEPNLYFRISAERDISMVMLKWQACNGMIFLITQDLYALKALVRSLCLVQNNI